MSAACLVHDSKLHQPCCCSSIDGHRTRRYAYILGSGVLYQLSCCCSNPLKMGVPKRIPSLSGQLESKVFDLGGTRPIYRCRHSLSSDAIQLHITLASMISQKAHALVVLKCISHACASCCSVLVANNGMAAVKFIRSVQDWAYKFFGHEHAVAIVAMATPEDMRVDAEHIKMADQFVEVPGGSNNNNYANVRLIVQTAEKANVDAVWPGWSVPNCSAAVSVLQTPTIQVTVCLRLTPGCCKQSANSNANRLLWQQASLKIVHQCQPCTALLCYLVESCLAEMLITVKCFSIVKPVLLQLGQGSCLRKA